MQFTAAEWRRYVEAAEQQSSNLGERYRRMRYEDMIENPEMILEPVCHTFKIGWHPDMTRFLKHGMGSLDRNAAGNYRRILTTEQILEFEQLAGDLLKRMGYLVEEPVKTCRQGTEA